MKTEEDTGPKGVALGRQLIIEYGSCNPVCLLTKEKVASAMLKAAKDSHATIISSSFHQFSPQGVSGVVIIAESHFTVHTWPEHAYAAVDIFTCGESIDIDRAVQSMKAAFESDRVIISSDRNRGLISPPSVREPSGGSPGTPDLLPISWARAHKTAQPPVFHISIDIHGCETKNEKELGSLADRMCRLLDTPPRGGCRLDIREDTTGHRICRMAQFADAAMITGQFDLNRKTAYLDMFCERYEDPRSLAENILSALNGRFYTLRVSFRDET